MTWLMRAIYAIAVGVVAWLVCVFIGGLIETTSQPQLAFLGHFLVQYASLIAVIVALLAFVGGAPGALTAYFSRPRTRA